MPKYIRWTQGAVECYSRGCVCEGCETFELIGTRCKMKAAVIQLVQDIGLPPKDFDIPLNNKNMVLQDENDEEKEMIKIETKKLTIREMQIKNMLLNGKNFKEISKELGISTACVQSHLNNIYKKKGYHTREEFLRGENNKGIIVDEALDIKVQFDEEIKRQKEALISPQHYDIAGKYAKQITDLEIENAELKKRIETLENQPKPYIDFDEIRHKIQAEIDMLQAKLNALELLERELIL